MREIRSEIDIAAPPTTVWAILTNFEKWQTWNPIVKQVRGVATRGSKLNVNMRGKEGQEGQHYVATITTFEEPLFFRWRAKMIADFLFANDKVFELKETPGGTKLVHTEAFSGILVSLFWGKLDKQVPTILKTMNEAVKTKAET
ncbi:MAG: SRPBCC domain-containing protein [Candidatus Marinimicrobia bacterium]|nr:SRPBCC domain-containing protein [Candidatus Neomarinimicrobiota bacterium]